MINATNEGGKTFAPIAPGTYPARCYSMVHIGTVTEEYQGEKKEQNKVRITWELPTELKEFKEGQGEKPYVISKDYTLSLHEKSNLRQTLKSWRGKDFTEDEARKFDITKLLGVACMLSIGNKERNGNVYAEITAVTPPMKGLSIPAQINPTFEFNYSEFDFNKFNTLPEWIRKKMETTPEYKKAVSLEMNADEIERQKYDESQSEERKGAGAKVINDLPF